MRTSKLGTLLLVTALLLAAAAAVVVLFAPLQTSTTVTFSTDGTTTHSTTRTLLADQGSAIAIFAMIPVVFVVVPTAAYAARARRVFLPLAAGAVVLLTVFVLLTGFSIGLLYGPALLALIAAFVVICAPHPASEMKPSQTPLPRQ